MNKNTWTYIIDRGTTTYPYKYACLCDIIYRIFVYYMQSVRHLIKAKMITIYEKYTN